MKRSLLGVLLAGVLASVAHGTTVLTLNPVNGALSGDPGQVVGWGFTIQDDVHWVVVTGTDFCSSFTMGDLFPCDGIHPVGNGTYLDFTAFNFVDSPPSPAPPDSSQQNFSYNPPCGTGPCTGTGGFTIDMGAAFGTLISGVIVVNFDLYTGDPAVAGVLFSQDNKAIQSASVFVVPEPATLLLFGSALAGLALLRLRRRARR